jgi:membrane protein implicated in regulation of membrane protease activity
MADWITWFLAAGVLVIVELLTGTFYILMLAIGVAAGGLAALAGAGVAAQTATASVVGVLATAILWRSRFGKPVRSDAATDANVNLDIGQTITVPAWQDGTARVMYRGAMWDVELAPGSKPEAGHCTIRAVRGSRLIVAPARAS